MDLPLTPTLDAIRKVKDQSEAIGEFLEWIAYHDGYAMAQIVPTERRCLYSRSGPRYSYRCVNGILRYSGDNEVVDPDPICPGCSGTGYKPTKVDEDGKPETKLVYNTTPIEKLLAEYFEIDLDEAERERMTILEHVRSQG